MGQKKRKEPHVQGSFLFTSTKIIYFPPKCKSLQYFATFYEMLKDEFCTPEGLRCVILRGRGGACLTCGGARPTLSCNAHNLLLRNESISCAQQKLPCPGKGNPLLVGRCKVGSVSWPRIHRRLIDNTYLQTTTYGARGVNKSKQHRNATSL